MMRSTTELRRIRARVRGTVQGVGFRPYVYRLATELGLAGFVVNDEQGVVVEVEGTESALAAFVQRLPSELPPLARVQGVESEDLPPTGSAGFAIGTSERHGDFATPIAADAATCAACLAELFDPANRRYRYPFLNCTDCGPRFTIIIGAPYDRPLTTMAGFAMCDDCRREYDDPANRRFHAQPNACPVCGPTVRLVDAVGSPFAFGSPDPIQAAARALLHGAIVAVKGLGGYHLACRADDEAAVGALRSRKHREAKPFALMVRDVDAARRLVELTVEEEALLTSRMRPIVLATRRPGARVAAAVAPRSQTLGIMLPYSPLHHLLLADSGVPLVLTSGNIFDEPIAYRDDDAMKRLARVADLFLVHDRPIETRTDDSVVRVVGPERRTQLLRRSRGYVPEVMTLPLEAPPLLACGAELKSTFCLARGREAWMGHHIGDLKNFETLTSFREGVAHFQRLFQVTPSVIAHDLHPDYLSTTFATEQGGIPLVAVQHHHAHLAACLAEHGETGPAIGAIFDGTGYGTDGTVWGGEFLLGDLAGFERVGHLWPVRLPGGDRAVREPWRMTCAWLAEIAGAEPEIPGALRGLVRERDWAAVAQLALSGMLAPVTTSAGRLFDAVAALSGLAPRTDYEGQAAIELEAIAVSDGAGFVPMTLVAEPTETGSKRLLLDPRETIQALARDLASSIPAAVVAARFHTALADATVRACSQLAEWCDVRTIVLSGGVFQNARLLDLTERGLREAGLRVLTPSQLPPNDGGIAFGQAAVAAATFR